MDFWPRPWPRRQRTRGSAAAAKNFKNFDVSDVFERFRTFSGVFGRFRAFSGVFGRFRAFSDVCPGTFSDVWGRFLNVLGSIFPLGGNVGVIFALLGPKLVQETSSKRLMFEQAIVHETLCFPYVFDFVCPRWHPKRALNHPKTGPRSSWIAVFRLQFPLRCLIVLGSVWVPF